MTTEFVEEMDDVVLTQGGMSEKQTSDDYNRAWDMLEAVRDEKSNLSVMVVDASKGGLVVDLGVRGFIPKSEIATRNPGNLERYIGQTLDVKVTEVDREKARVVLSERRAADEKRAALRAETLSKLEKGMLVDGVVRRITDFGAFVDIGGIDGLLHVSDISWEQVKHPSDELKVGDKLQLLVLKIERDGERISLGLKQLTDDPWTIARRNIREYDLIEVTILRVIPEGAVAKVADGVEGFIPEREYGDRHASEEDTVKVEAGATVTVKILEFRQRERRLTLSIKQAARERERQVTRDYMKKQREDVATPTLGDLFGDVFSKFNKD